VSFQCTTPSFQKPSNDGVESAVCRPVFGGCAAVGERPRFTSSRQAHKCTSISEKPLLRNSGTQFLYFAGTGASWPNSGTQFLYFTGTGASWRNSGTQFLYFTGTDASRPNSGTLFLYFAGTDASRPNSGTQFLYFAGTDASWRNSGTQFLYSPQSAHPEPETLDLSALKHLFFNFGPFSRKISGVLHLAD
jgi:hypothetical protein